MDEQLKHCTARKLICLPVTQAHASSYIPKLRVDGRVIAVEDNVSLEFCIDTMGVIIHW